jgi:hypothetical protein
MIYNIKPKYDRWGNKIGGNGGGWSWKDIVIGALLFIAVMAIKQYFGIPT